MKALPVTKPAIKMPAMPKMPDKTAIRDKVRARIEEAKKRPIVRKAQPVTKTLKPVASKPTRKIINMWRAF
jgi:hypothetical protein